jgi:hypothetical protein
MRFYNYQHQYYCGIDLHARSMYLHVLDQQGHPLRTGPARRTRRLFRRESSVVQPPLEFGLPSPDPSDKKFNRRLVAPTLLNS